MDEQSRIASLTAFYFGARVKPRVCIIEGEFDQSGDRLPGTHRLEGVARRIHEELDGGEALLAVDKLIDLRIPHAAALLLQDDSTREMGGIRHPARPVFGQPPDMQPQRFPTAVPGSRHRDAGRAGCPDTSRTGRTIPHRQPARAVLQRFRFPE